MMKWINKIVLLLLFLSAFACKDKKRMEVETIINEWVGKEIKFPDNFQCCQSGNDTISAFYASLFQAEYKILLYVDSTGCSDCRLKLFEWKQLITEADSLFAGKLSFLFFLQPKDEKELIFLLKSNGFDYPVWIDRNNTIEQLNHFPQQDSYQCFLLDKNNQVLIIGNPVLNLKIWELYKQMITGETDTEQHNLQNYVVPDIRLLGKNRFVSFNLCHYSLVGKGDNPVQKRTSGKKNRMLSSAKTNHL